MARSTLRHWSVRFLAVYIGAAGAILAQVVLQDEGAGQQFPAIHVDFAYDASDPQLVAGDATVVAVATVEREVGNAGDRTVFRVIVHELLEGTMPDRYNVSQLGFRADGKDYELDGLPLMTPGRTYVMALVAPSAREPQDALLVLSAMAGGNLVEIDGVRSLNPAVDRYRTAVARQRSPWAPADRMDEKRADDYRRWRPGA